ncbi:MAG: carboxypeptidase regulatory-like domain-containing protein [Bryobacteraceae bacterium]
MKQTISRSLILIVFSAIALNAQTVSGTLAGTIADATGASVPGAKIVARNEETLAVREAETNAQGYYLLPFMPLGNYEITVTLKGFQTLVKKGVIVDLNRTTSADFELRPAQVSETVEVTSETPLIETAQGDVKHSLTERQIEDTPLAGRNFMSLVEQVPGFGNAPWIGSSNNPTQSTGSYAAFNGQGSRSTTFQIDGVNNDDSSENQNRQNVNISSIREFQILTNSYTAEFGRAGGAVVLVQTKSGNNRLHGDAYNFHQSDVFNANSFFNNRAGVPKGGVDRHQYGWTIGGPLKRNKLFFFHSAERVRDVASVSISRFVWLPSDGPRACNQGETAQPGGPYCVDPATHPNLQRDLDWMKGIMKLWDTGALKGKTPSDAVTCADLIASGRPNRCVRIDGVTHRFPDSDYSGKLDWMAPYRTTVALRYQYSRQLRAPGHIIAGDSAFQNNRQYNIGLTATHVFSPRQTGEFRFGFGNRTTLVDVADGNHIPTIRFESTLGPSGTAIGSSTSTPINRRQRDRQFVYNHTIMLSRHTVKAGADVRIGILDDITGDRARGFWTFGSNNTLAQISSRQGFTGWENFLRGVVTGYQIGYGNDLAENRFKEANLYFQDDLRVTRNLTLNFGARWEGVSAPREKADRFSYGFNGDYNNLQPRFGFAWRPSTRMAWLQKAIGRPGEFVIRGGYGIFHSRIFQSIFSQNQLSIRTQPPNGFARVFSAEFPNEISDPSGGFVFTPGITQRSTAAQGGGVFARGGTLQSTLIVPDRKLHLSYVQQWNLALARNLPRNMAVEITYNGNRGIGVPFYDSSNDARFPMASPLVSVDVGGGNLQPLVFDRVCSDARDPICQTLDAAGNVVVATSGTLKTFSALASTTATLAQKGIAIENGVPHGYISLGTPRTNERRSDPSFVRNVTLRNFGWTYYHGLVTKFSKRSARGLSFTGTWTFSKAIDTGSEQTFTGVDANAPTGKGNAARSLRGLSSFHSPHRIVLSYGYELPWMRAQRGLIGRIAGGWTITGLSVFQSGTPYTVLLGYDANLDGLGSDRPNIADPSYLYRSVDGGRQISPCPAATVAVCQDTLSQLQVPGSVFIPGQAGTIGSESRIISAGADGTGSIGRNTFFTHGISNFDTTFQKGIRVREGWRLTLRMEFYNLFNRVSFGVPARTVLSTTPMGRITGTRNVNGFVGSARSGGSRGGQIAVRFTF